MCGTSWFPGGSHLCCSKSSGVYGWSHVKKLLYRRRWVAYCSRKYDFGGPQSCLQIHSLLLAMQRELSYASSLGLSFLTWKMEMVTTSWDCGKDEMRQKGWARGRESKLTVLLRHEHYIHVKSQKSYPKTNCFCQSFRSAKILVLRAEMSGIRVFFLLPYVCIFQATSQSSPCVGFYLALIYKPETPSYYPHWPFFSVYHLLFLTRNYKLLQATRFKN